MLAFQHRNVAGLAVGGKFNGTCAIVLPHIVELVVDANYLVTRMTSLWNVEDVLAQEKRCSGGKDMTASRLLPLPASATTTAAGNASAATAMYERFIAAMLSGSCAAYVDMYAPTGVQWYPQWPALTGRAVRRSVMMMMMMMMMMMPPPSCC